MAASARFELAHARVKVLCLTTWLRGNLSGGGTWIWTMEPLGTDLQSAAFDHFAIPPKKMVPTKGIEPSTYWLQVSCSTYWAKSANNKWWAMRDSNSRPPACKADALTNWANRPNTHLPDNYKYNILFNFCQ